MPLRRLRRFHRRFDQRRTALRLDTLMRWLLAGFVLFQGIHWMAFASFAAPSYAAFLTLGLTPDLAGLLLFFSGAILMLALFHRRYVRLALIFPSTVQCLIAGCFWWTSGIQSTATYNYSGLAVIYSVLAVLHSYGNDDDD